MDNRKEVAFAKLEKLAQEFPRAKRVGHRTILCYNPVCFEAKVDMDGLLKLKVNLEVGSNIEKLLRSVEFDEIAIVLNTYDISSPWTCEECEEQFTDRLVCELSVKDDQRTLRVRLTNDHMRICEDISEGWWRGDFDLLKRLTYDLIPYFDEGANGINLDCFIEEASIPLKYATEVLDRLNIATPDPLNIATEK